MCLFASKGLKNHDESILYDFVDPSQKFESLNLFDLYIFFMNHMLYLWDKSFFYFLRIISTRY